MKRIETIEAEIGKITEKLAKMKEHEDQLAAKLEQLQEQKRQAQSKKIMEAFRRSGRSFGEIMTFLNP